MLKKQDRVDNKNICKSETTKKTKQVDSNVQTHYTKIMIEKDEIEQPFMLRLVSQAHFNLIS